RTSLPPTPWHPERADLARVARAVLLDVVADVPDRAVVNGIDSGLRVVLPSLTAGAGTIAAFSAFAGNEDGFLERQLSLRIIWLPSRESLARKRRRSAVRVADADVAELVHRRARHPAEESVRRVRALLIERDRSI